MGKAARYLLGGAVAVAVLLAVGRAGAGQPAKYGPARLNYDSLMIELDSLQTSLTAAQAALEYTTPESLYWWGGATLGASASDTLVMVGATKIRVTCTSAWWARPFYRNADGTGFWAADSLPLEAGDKINETLGIDSLIVGDWSGSGGRYYGWAKGPFAP